VWWRANEGSNSIGNLLLHLEGSTRTWIIGVAGENQVSEALLLALKRWLHLASRYSRSDGEVRYFPEA